MNTISIESHCASSTLSCPATGIFAQGQEVTAQVPTIRDLLAGEPLRSAQLTSLMSSVRSRVSTRLRAIEGMAMSGHRNAARREQRQFLNWLDARLLALYETRPFKIGGDLDETAALIEGLLNHLPYLGRGHRGPTAFVRWKPKAEGGRRPIFRFAWADKAEQWLISRALTPFVSFHPTQAMLREPRARRGRTAACEDLRTALTNAPTHHVLLQLDVVNFHGTVNHAWLEANLALPKRQLLHLVHTGQMRLVPEGSRRARPTDGELEELTRRGIPQGSAAAPRIAEYVMAEVLRSFADRLPCTLAVVYSDNIAVLVPRREATAMAELFRAAFRAHEAGPFDLRWTTTPLDQEIRFLGYSWRVQEGSASAYVPAEKALAWMTAVEQSIYRARPSDLADIRQYVRGWCGSRHLWSGAMKVEEHLLGLIDKMKPVTYALAADPRARTYAEDMRGWPGFAPPGPQTARTWTPAPEAPAWRRWQPFNRT